MRSGGGRKAGFVAAAAVAALGFAAAAQGAPSTGPLTLPETLRATVRVPLPGHARQAMPADTLRDLYLGLAACWEVPPHLGRAEITARFSLRRDGSLIGAPRVTFSTEGPNTRASRILVDATLAAIRRCTPARITPALGAAIAGRPIALRFVYQEPNGQGV